MRTVISTILYTDIISQLSTCREAVIEHIDNVNKLCVLSSILCTDVTSQFTTCREAMIEHIDNVNKRRVYPPFCIVLLLFIASIPSPCHQMIYLESLHIIIASVCTACVLFCYICTQTTFQT